MARLILDTTILVEAERDGAVLDAMIDDADDVAIAAITAAELLVGVELADRRRRPAREAFVADLLDTLPIEDYDLATAEVHARLLADVRRTGKPRGAHDLIIAATGVATRREIVTTDARGFAGLPEVVLRGVANG